jgi:hypothetical protein
VCLSLLIATIPASAATLGDVCQPGAAAPPCNDTLPSLGSAQIQVAAAFKPLFAGYPGFTGSSGVLQSPVLYDPSTVIGRSIPIKDGSGPDIAGLPVGAGGTIVSDGLLTAPGGFMGGGVGANEVHTQIVSFDLKNPSGTVQIRAGAAASDRPNSLGEVQSQSNSGMPANDFPASSFFDIFVDVDLPAFGGFDGGTVHNTSALQVYNNALASLPPRVIYIHGNSNAVPIFFNTNDPGGQYHAGDQLGWLILAGHGAGYMAAGVDANGNWAGPDVTQFQTFMSMQTPLQIAAPEPGTMMIMLSGLAALIAVGRWRRSV